MMGKQWIAALALGLCASSFASAAPTTLGLASFGAGDTVIDFNTYDYEVAFTDQYSANGVLFSGSLYSDSNDNTSFPYDENNWTVASNCKYSQYWGCITGRSWTAEFTTLHTRIGFDLLSYPGEVSTLDFYRDGVHLGGIGFDSNLGSQFKGFEVLGGFNAIVFNQRGGNAFFAINDMRYGGEVTPVPEPASYGMLALGLGLIGFMARHRKI